MPSIKKITKAISIFTLLMAFFSCSSYRTQVFEASEVPTTPDYNKESSWAILPNKYPENFKEYASKQQDTLKVDVFYLYPTLNTSKKDIRWNVPIDDEEQNEKVIHKAVLYQASAFASAGKVYVPFYRQAHLRSYELYEKGGKEAQELAYADVKKAFEIYLEKYNNGRPILMVGHSQGTTHTLKLLKDFFDNKPLQKQLIAAYIPGIRVKPDEFTTIKPMVAPNEKGGFVSWNTFKKNNYPKKDKNWYKGSVTTNPISWDSAKTSILDQHKGFLYTNGKIYKKALKIEVTDGLIWSTNPKFPMRFFMSFLKNYHAGDINLFWQDIRENAILRTNSYLKNSN